MRRLGFKTIRNRLLLIFFAITAGAVVFIYLYVVPQLQSNLTSQKLKSIEEVAGQESETLSRAMRNGASPQTLRRLVTRAAEQSDARVTILGVRSQAAGGEPAPAFVVEDSQQETTATLPRYGVAAAAVTSGNRTTGVERVGGVRVGETAIPISLDGRPKWVVVFSSSLADVEDNVALIKRQILIAGAIALAAALLAGFFAARATSQRVRRLERAAQQVAEGDFAVEIPVDSSDELGQLARTFNEMQQRLAQLDSARKEFIATASHELRTPIFSLGGFVELLGEGTADKETTAEFVRAMREQVERLTKLTTDLLDLSRIDAGELEVRAETVDLGALAESLATEFLPAARQHGSKLELRAADEPAMANADPDRVSQIIRILLDNALAHTPEGTPVTVTTLRDNGMAELIVSDEGPGLTPRISARVFERFYTGDSATGSGLGLAIARELAARMNGRLDVKTGKGFTAFTLELPLP